MSLDELIPLDLTSLGLRLVSSPRPPCVRRDPHTGEQGRSPDFIRLIF